MCTFIPADGSAPITETINHAASKIDFSQYTGTADQKKELNGQGIYTTCCTCSNHYSIKFSNGGGDKTEQSGQHYIYTIDISNGQAIPVFKKAIEYVNEERSRMGAYQNRLEHTVKNLDNVVENTQAAESLLRDADMAKEMVKFSNMNIIAQAGQAMLAQANQMNQGVLSLIQS